MMQLCCIISTEAYRSGHNEAVLKTVWGKPHGGSNPSASAKKILQKRIHFLQYFFIQVADLVYHNGLACISSALWVVYHHRRCIPLRLDEMQHLVLMIYHNKLRMIYKATP